MKHFLRPPSENPRQALGLSRKSHRNLRQALGLRRKSRDNSRNWPGRPGRRPENQIEFGDAPHSPLSDRAWKDSNKFTYDSCRALRGRFSTIGFLPRFAPHKYNTNELCATLRVAEVFLALRVLQRFARQDFRIHNVNIARSKNHHIPGIRAALREAKHCPPLQHNSASCCKISFTHSILFDALHVAKMLSHL